MARIRSVKPELRRDLTVAEWPREVRYAWVLLWGYLDDHGRGHDDMRLLVADLFPLDRDVTERKLDGWLRIMAARPTGPGTPPLCRYERAGRHYLHAPKWKQSQRVSHPQTSALPSCPVHDLDGNDSRTIPESVPKEVGDDPEPFVPSRTPEDQGVKGSRDRGAESGGVVIPPVDEMFETWWTIYPRREAKVAARKAFAKALKAASVEQIMGGAARYRDDPNRLLEFTPHPASWLNAERWDDDPLPQRQNWRPMVLSSRSNPNKEW